MYKMLGQDDEASGSGTQAKVFVILSAQRSLCWQATRQPQQLGYAQPRVTPSPRQRDLFAEPHGYLHHGYRSLGQ